MAPVQLVKRILNGERRKQMTETEEEAQPERKSGKKQTKVVRSYEDEEIDEA